MGIRRRGRRSAPPPAEGPRVNEQIRASRVVVIDDEGNRLGEFQPRDALGLAQERGLDLVEVAPDANPPVCKFADYGRMKYDRKKQKAQSKRTQTTRQLKELKVRPKTDDHDLSVKIRKARDFLDRGDLVKIVVFFRGREHAHRDIGAEQCMRIAEAVSEVGKVDSPPRMEGRRMQMILSPV